MTDLSQQPSQARPDSQSGGPELLPPLLLKPALITPVIIGGTVAAGVFFWAFANGGPGFLTASEQNQKAPPPPIVLQAADYPGSVMPLEPALAAGSKHVMAALVMPEPEKNRLKAALDASRVRIGAITLWDNVHEDGDVVTVSGAGFTQDLLILHKPVTFFVPYSPGGVVTIHGSRDGGGGITLGLRTALGDQRLPPLATGQTIEIQIP